MMVEVYLRHKDGVVQKHHVNKWRTDRWFERLVDKTQPEEEYGRTI